MRRSTSKASEAHVPNDGLAEPLVQYFPLRVEREDDRECKSIFSRDKTAQLLAEGRRKHGDTALHEIHAGGALASIPVQSRVRLDEEGYVGDVNTDFVVAIFGDLDRKSIVEILRGLWIDGEYPLFAHILASLELMLRDTTTTCQQMIWR